MSYTFHKIARAAKNNIDLDYPVVSRGYTVMLDNPKIVDIPTQRLQQVASLLALRIQTQIKPVLR